MATYAEPIVDRRVAPRDIGDSWAESRAKLKAWSLAKFLVPLGRALFAAIFLASVPGHFSAAYINHAAQAGVPMANILVPLSGLVALVGGLSVLIGFRARVGAWLLIAFLIPVTFTMHAFWAVSDPALQAIQQAQFMKNLALIGGALLIGYWGAGPVSVDLKRLWRE